MDSYEWNKVAGAVLGTLLIALGLSIFSEILFETEATINGEIADAPRGEHGFGYDPIFFYPPLGRTTAELPLDEKSAVSHRARAFRDFVRWVRVTM